MNILLVILIKPMFYVLLSTELFLKTSTENLFVNLGEVERRKFLCFITSLGPTSLVDKRANNWASAIKEANQAED